MDVRVFGPDALQSDLAASSESRGLTESSFQQIFARYNRPVYSFFANRGFSKEESRDLTQETFLEAFRSLPSFRGESSFETWLFAIAKNVWRLDLRRRSRTKRSGEEVSLEAIMEHGQLSAADGKGASDLEEPLDRFLGKERALLLRAAIVDLPEQMRNCLLLRLVQDLKYHEIAATLQVSLGTVKSQLFEARCRLRERLAELFDEIVEL
jgi:RNA polymerase sigma-70 factor (ECF subfamily)